MITKKRFTLFLCILIAVLAAFAVYKVYFNQPFSIDIIYTGDAGSGNLKVARGIVEELTDQGYRNHIDFDYAYSGTDQTSLSEVAWLGPQTMQGSPNAIVALGAVAAEVAISAASEQKVPVVFAAFSNPVKNASTHATGMISSIAEESMRFVKEVQPNLKTLGVFYKDEDSKLMAHMRDAAAKFGVKVFAHRASDKSTLESDEKKLSGVVDAFFVYNTSRDVLERVVKAGISSKKPIYVSNIDFVLKDSQSNHDKTSLTAIENEMYKHTRNMDLMQQGVLATIDLDKYELGRQLGKMIARLMRGEKPGEIPLRYMQKQKISVNSALAEKLGLQPDVQKWNRKRQQTNTRTKRRGNNSL